MLDFLLLPFHPVLLLRGRGRVVVVVSGFVLSLGAFGSFGLLLLRFVRALFGVRARLRRRCLFRVRLRGAAGAGAAGGLRR